MKRQEHNAGMLMQGSGGNAPSLAELREIRRAQKATNQRVDELKARLFRITEQHMDQAVSLVRRWMNAK